MFYTKKLGITSTKAELVAILQFTGKTERNSCVGFTVQGGKLLVQTNNGHAAAYHHGEASDGKGGTYKGEHTWQVGGEALARVAKSMSSKDEVVLAVSDTGRLTVALVREESDGDPKIKVDLDGHVAEQLTFDATSRFPGRPVPSGMALSQVCVDPHLLGPIAKVSRACNGGASRWTMPSDPKAPVYIEVDTGGALADDLETAAWVIVVMPMVLGEEVDNGPDYREEAERILAEGRVVPVEPIPLDFGDEEDGDLPEDGDE